MHRRESNRSGHRRIVSIGIAGLLALAALGLTQCRLVDDRITGVDLQSTTGLNARSNCVRECNELYKQCKRDEEVLHREKLAACDGLGSASSRKNCKKAELERHQIAHLQCVADKKTCKFGCYNEGAGSLGS